MPTFARGRGAARLSSKIHACLPALLALLVAVAAGCATTAAQELPTVEVLIGSARLVAEAPQSDQDRWRGLSGRDGLAPGRGMVFINDPPRMMSMRMDGMRFALDFVFCRDGRVVRILRDVGPEAPEGSIVSDEPVDFVLELPAGLCRRLGLQVGDAARLGPLTEPR
ncbi:protein of unknown function DUF192 [Desulfarculus baarsii DSM 2075]|uniref:DUF192 domain-containing protein n=1 Tax=Desulfarculus baarsii (strain ATCC 33931 / DSM 2075 / LMG 7858 / VKM B-1802 / 2st14) TaxID=644282 RepID=E1QI93_DESB2|nr:DUF192 domain-containing protein [Desulfarculus baarsii]ADK85410.1 protein of unknown function DUF192 [Desulfarculus baarsii DSM 2075]